MQFSVIWKFLVKCLSIFARNKKGLSQTCFYFKFQRASKYTFKHISHFVDFFKNPEIERQVFTPKTMNYNSRILELKQD